MERDLRARVGDDGEREALPVGTRLTGPAVIREDRSTTFVLPGQRATVGSLGEIVIERTEGS